MNWQLLAMAWFSGALAGWALAAILFTRADRGQR